MIIRRRKAPARGPRTAEERARVAKLQADARQSYVEGAELRRQMDAFDLLRAAFWGGRS